MWLVWTILGLGLAATVLLGDPWLFIGSIGLVLVLPALIRFMEN